MKSKTKTTAKSSETFIAQKAVKTDADHTEKIKTKKTILTFVCTGNTCRSPMAEMIMKHILVKEGVMESYTVKSAGLHPNEGEPMAENARQALKEMGIKAPKRSAKSLTVEQCKRSDMIVCMTNNILKEMQMFRPKAVSVAEITGGSDVSDPYGQDLQAYKRTAEYLLYACGDIYSRLKKICEEKTKN